MSKVGQIISNVSESIKKNQISKTLPDTAKIIGSKISSGAKTAGLTIKTGAKSVDKAFKTMSNSISAQFKARQKMKLKPLPSRSEYIIDGLNSGLDTKQAKKSVECLEKATNDLVFKKKSASDSALVFMEKGLTSAEKKIDLIAKFSDKINKIK